jgi:hypothetical protein
MRFFSFLAIAGLVACTRANQNDATPVALRIASPQVPRGLAGIYWGVTDTPMVGRAWLVRMGSRGDSGKIYMGPNDMLSISVAVDSGGHVMFHSTAVNDVVVEYRGEAVPNGIQGSIKLARRPLRVAIPYLRTSYIASLLLKHLVLAPDDPARGLSSGLYSNTQYNPDSGDLVGDEFILIRSTEGPFGLFASSSEGFIPYVATNLSFTGYTAQFSIRTARGDQHYRVLANRIGQLIISRDDSGADLGVTHSLLSRRSSIEALFR